MTNEFEMGYQDALRQFQRLLHRRQKALEDELKSTGQDECIMRGKILEIQHIIEVVDSLRR